jgi:hypothetical protein
MTCRKCRYDFCWICFQVTPLPPPSLPLESPSSSPPPRIGKNIPIALAVISNAQSMLGTIRPKVGMVVTMRFLALILMMTMEVQPRKQLVPGNLSLLLLSALPVLSCAELEQGES